MKRFSTFLGSLALATVLLFSSCEKPTGCMDPYANNYDSAAEENCCCTYNPTTNFVVSGAIMVNTTWTSDNVYELAGKVIVENGITLTIQAGTIIKGRPGTGSLASALVVAQGGVIEAEGTSDAPIIFTSTLDNIEVGSKTGSNLTELDNGKWGGLILLGKAPISAEEGDDESQIEGIPADESYGKYGGNDPFDNSGILTYVSIRHGGALIGEGNEINGLTLGGVGAGTTIHHIEVVGNLDDGVECFGGTVNLQHVMVAFQGDDGIDLDQNYSGTIDNFFVMHGVDTDEGLEIDGPEGSLTNGRFTLKNGTVMSVDGMGSAADLKSGAQGTLESVTFWGYGENNCLKLRHSFESDCATDLRDAYLNFLDPTGDQELTIIGCEFEGFSAEVVTEVYTKSTDQDEVSCEVPSAYQVEAATAVTNAGSAFGASVPSVGATPSVFDGWSWAHANGKY